MTEKERCKLLRQIRKELAESNGIVYLTSECTHVGDCKGTCSACEAEIRYLDSEFQRLADLGKSISLTGLSLNSFKLNTSSPVEVTSSDFEEDNTERIMEMPIEELDLNFRVANLLKATGFMTVADIVQYIQHYGIDGLKYIRLRGAHFTRLKRTLSDFGIKLEYRWPEYEIFVPSGITEDFEIEGTILKKYTGTNTYVRIPYGITDIDWYEFNRNGNAEIIEELKLPPTLRKIGDLSGCKNLKSIRFPPHIDEWEDGTFGAFSHLKKIEEICLPEGVRDLNSTFNHCENLKSISFPSSIKSIDGFALCTGGTSGLEVSFRGDHPDFYVENDCLIQKSTQTLVRYIGKPSLSINIPKNVRVIGQGAFAQCDALKTIDVPYGVEVISDQAFLGCKNLDIVTIPSTVKNIGIWLFGARSPQIIISPENRYYHVIDNYIVEIPTQTIVYVLDRNIKEAIIPEGIKEIGKGAFSAFFYLEKVVLPNTITAIRETAFSECDKLKEINLPNSLEIIESQVFRGCYSLDYIVIPANLRTFGEAVFAVGYDGGKPVRIFCEYSIAELKALALDWKKYGGVTIYSKGRWCYEGEKPVPNTHPSNKSKETYLEFTFDEEEFEM